MALSGSFHTALHEFGLVDLLPRLMNSEFSDVFAARDAIFAACSRFDDDGPESIRPRMGRMIYELLALSLLNNAEPTAETSAAVQEASEKMLRLHILFMQDLEARRLDAAEDAAEQEREREQ